jgi:hypothetical protein
LGYSRIVCPPLFCSQSFAGAIAAWSHWTTVRDCGTSFSNLDAAASQAIQQGHFPTVLASSHGHMLCKIAMAMRNTLHSRGYDKS